MWAYDDDGGRGRRTRDLPRTAAGPSRSSAAYYYDDAYDRPTYSSSRYQQPDSQPSSSHRSHRRKSVPAADLSEPKSSRHANVVASDDGSEFYRRSTRDPYAYPERTSRHDAEGKSGDRNKKFREKRGTYETDEMQNLRRAKSHSPRRAAREVEAARNPSPPTTKSTWGGADAADLYGRSSSKKSSKVPQKYYDTDPYTADYGSSRGRDAGAYDYTSAGMPRPPMGGAATASAAAPEEKPSKHSRRSKHHHSNANPYEDDYAATAASYDRGGAAAAAYPVDEKPSRHRSHHSSAKPRDDPVDPYAAASSSPRGRHRGEVADYEDPYGGGARSAPPPSRKNRQSMPPRTRSRYDGAGEADAGPGGDYGEDPYYNPTPRRRAVSVHHGGGYYGDRYGSDPGRERRAPQQYYDDERYGGARASPGGSPGAGGAGVGRTSSKKEKGKQWQKQAGKLFMTHAVPVIKKEAVPFLTKAAQAYFEQKR